MSVGFGGPQSGRGRRPLPLIAAAILIGIPAPAGAGSVKGLVTVEGWSAKHGSSELQPPLPPAVWVDGQSASAPPQDRPGLSQRNVQFSSPLMVVVAGQTADIANPDDLAHNLYYS